MDEKYLYIKNTLLENSYYIMKVISITPTKVDRTISYNVYVELIGVTYLFHTDIHISKTKHMLNHKYSTYTAERISAQIHKLLYGE